MGVRKILLTLGLVAALTLATAACGDSTVIGSPADTTAQEDTPAANASVGVSDQDSAAVADTELSDIDQLLRDIEADLSAVDHDVSTPEGDPTE